MPFHNKDKSEAPNPGVRPPQVGRKLWQRFYEPVVLLAAFEKTQGKVFRHKDDIEIRDVRKSLFKEFLDQLAYVCDFEPGGNTVTAIAMEQGSQPTYRISSLGDRRRTVVAFMNQLLLMLGEAHGLNETASIALRRRLNSYVAQSSIKRLQLSKEKLFKAIGALERNHLQDCDMVLRGWLNTLSDSKLDISDLCHKCYEARFSKNLQLLEQYIHDSWNNPSDAFRKELVRVRYHIDLLGSHLKAIQILFTAGQRFPQLFVQYRVFYHMHETAFEAPWYRNKASLDGIINRMVKDPETCKMYQREIHLKDQSLKLDLQSRVEAEYKDPNFVLHVHAEIILLDVFHREHMQFLHDVRYIGVSKPSCILCHRYFLAHPLLAQTSGFNNHLSLQWQPPLVPDGCPSKVKAQEDIMNKMVEGIRLFVLDKILSNNEEPGAHPDFATRIDTSEQIEVGASTTGHADYHSSEAYFISLEVTEPTDIWQINIDENLQQSEKCESQEGNEIDYRQTISASADDGGVSLPLDWNTL